MGVNSTPTLYINGRAVIGAQPFESFKPIIDEELARSDEHHGRHLQDGSSRAQVSTILPRAPGSITADVRPRGIRQRQLRSDHRIERAALQSGDDRLVRAADLVRPECPRAPGRRPRSPCS